MASNSNKRQRHDGERSSYPNLRLTDFPDALLVGVASYLPHSACISFADALAPQHLLSEQQLVCKSIVAQHDWETLDLKDVQDIYKRRLTDDDVRWILMCIDAVNHVKYLKLTDCLALTGSGLEPLRGSIVLEQIDLSLAGYENPDIQPEPYLAVSEVIPILNSILDREDNSLKHVQLPKKWRDERSDTLTNFLVRFDRILNNRRIQCSNKECAEICRGEGDDQTPLIHIDSGMAQNTCYLCRNTLCNECGVDIMNHCLICERYFCRDCCTVNYCQGSDCSALVQPTSCEFCDVVKGCDGCRHPYCPDCSSFSGCQYCDEVSYCDECARYHTDTCRGEDCTRANCSTYSDNGCDCLLKHRWSVECVTVCDDCGMVGRAFTYCIDCRAKKCKDEGWDKSCSSCVKLIAPVLLKENERLRSRGG